MLPPGSYINSLECAFWRKFVAPSPMQALRASRAHKPLSRTGKSSSRRSIAHSAPSRNALPFFLNTYKKAKDDHEHDQSRVLRMLMFGKPGAGKGTLSARLVKKYDIISMSTGDLLRQHIAERTEVGQEAEDIVARGGLLPDEVMLKVVTSKLDALNLHNKVRSLPTPRSSGVMLTLSSLAYSIGFWMDFLVPLDRENF